MENRKQKIIVCALINFVYATCIELLVNANARPCLFRFLKSPSYGNDCFRRQTREPSWRQRIFFHSCFVIFRFFEERGIEGNATKKARRKSMPSQHANHPQLFPSPTPQTTTAAAPFRCDCIHHSRTNGNSHCKRKRRSRTKQTESHEHQQR